MKYTQGVAPRKGQQTPFHYSAIAGSILLASVPSWAADYFDPSFLGAAGENVDLSVFAESGGVAEGEYTASVFINQQSATQATLLFTKNAQGRIVPQLTPAFLAELGVNVDSLPEFKGVPPNEPITDLAELIPQASVKFDLSKLRLDVSIPQVAMKPHYRGVVDPSLWQDGIPALMSNYSLSAGQTQSTPNHGSKTRNSNLYANLRSGLNVGPWRLRSTYSHSYSDNNQGGSQTQRRFDNTYVSRDIHALRANLTMGESSTGYEVFDGFPFRGAQLQSSEEMLPDQLRGFSPNISGVANSNARVTVRQNGNIIYETYVAPGPFNINDLNQSGMSGDYDVTVTEADGSERQFIVPYSSLPMMLRPGGWKYELTGGRYDGNTTNGSREENFVLGTGAYGFQHNFTLYGGVLGAKDYQSFSAGAGVSLGYIGALSTDITSSAAKFNDTGTKHGQSYRVRYSKSLLSTGTSVDLTALRYSTEHYYNFSEFNGQGYRLNDGVSPWMMERRRNSFQTQLSQDFGAWGSLSLRGNRDDYWGSSKTMTGMSVGYSNDIKQITYNINYNIDRMKGDYGDWPENRQISLNINVPFRIFSQDTLYNSTYLTSSISHDNHGKTQNSMGLSGSVFDSKVSYGLSQNWGNQGQVSQSNLNVGYQGDKGSINTGYSYSNESKTMNMNASGGFLVHSGGVTLARSMGDSVALIHAPGASGVKVSSGNGETDRWGYAINPYLSNYKQNNIGLDPTTLPDGVDIAQSNVNVYPTKGAVVKVKFATRIGHQVLLNLTLNGGVVPFGAIATLIVTPSEDSTETPETLSSIVGDAGQVYLTGLPETGQLTVKWGKEPDQQCLASFNLSHLLGEGKGRGLAQADAICLRLGETVKPKSAQVNARPVTLTDTQVIPTSITSAATLNADTSALRQRWLTSRE